MPKKQRKKNFENRLLLCESDNKSDIKDPKMTQGAVNVAVTIKLTVTMTMISMISKVMRH
jgi:hypothetical protein